MQAARGTSVAEPDSHRPRRLRLLFAAVAIVLYLLDLGTKVWAIENLQGQPDVQVIGDFLQLSFVLNPGAAFGTGTGFTPVITCIAIVATVLVLWFARKVGSVGWALALGFLFAGVTGNLTDRLFRDPGPFHGHVVDMFMLPNWPVFNVADICINVAAGLIIIQAFRGIRVDGTREGVDDEPEVDESEVADEPENDEHVEAEPARPEEKA